MPYGNKKRCKIVWFGDHAVKCSCGDIIRVERDAGMKKERIQDMLLDAHEEHRLFKEAQGDK